MKLGSTALTGIAVVGLAVTPAFAQQSAKQDMKDAGSDVKSAAKNTGRATKKTTKKAYHKSKRGVNHAAAKVQQKTQ